MLTGLAFLMAASLHEFWMRLSVTRQKTQRTQHSNGDSPLDLDHHPVVDQIKSLGTTHETAVRLQTLIQTDGAGSWPPRAVHHAEWPEALHPYHEVYRAMSPQLASNVHLTDDRMNLSRCRAFRSQMTALLQAHINLDAVENALCDLAQGDGFSREACNGFFACVAYCRHAFRWATNPIVKVAQDDKVIDFPVELDIPWDYLCRRYGIYSQGGNAMSNLLCDFDTSGRMIYTINEGMPDIVRSSEYHFTYIFVEMERLAVPIYLHIAQSIDYFERGDKVQCAEKVRSIFRQLRRVFQVFYKTFVPSTVSPAVWLSYVQGFHGWAAGTIDGETYTEYDGVQGGQMVLIQVIDAFLGMDPFLSTEAFRRHVTYYQRGFIDSIRRHSFRQKALHAGDGEINTYMSNIAGLMQAFQSSYRKAMSKYLAVSAPERMAMAPGSSVLRGDRAVSNPLARAQALEQLEDL
ncbi:uncharacterized protein LDX57_007897 [Aspergillus melleus]|uniref:uncharacterized protein n=1 Tax=Aspergillus melleus TaxID=138277 RepID=UPI001E8CAC3D|nr:uncharacterized protein LDX57_007897 [Aspergillus melleus]KAH8430228.1 hypothetical protein LDX57_007897 [Aspergillus melleus]